MTMNRIEPNFYILLTFEIDVIFVRLCVLWTKFEIEPPSDKKMQTIMQTLEEVIDHFSSGGLGHINQSELVVPLELTALEKSQLLAFLTSLTDLEFLMNSELSLLN